MFPNGGLLHNLRNMTRTRNNDPRPEVRSLTRGLQEIVQDRLPPGWSSRVKSLANVRAKTAAPDALLEIKAPNGDTALLAVEVRRFAGPSSIEKAVQQLALYSEGGGVVVAPYLPRSARERLIAAGVGYVDLTGNIQLRTTEPALFVRDVGGTRNPWRASSTPVSLRGSSATRIVRALCDFRPPIGIRELASRASVSAGYVSRLLPLLEREGLIERAVPLDSMPARAGQELSPVGYERRGPIVLADWKGLVDRWCMDYSFDGTNTVSQFLEPRGVDAALANIRRLKTRLVLTGPVAAGRVASIAPTLVVSAFTESARRAAEQLDLRRVARSGNVLLAEPFSDVVYERTSSDSGLQYAAFSQVLADLKTTPGRALAEAEALADWMSANESRWRLA